MKKKKVTVRRDGFDKKIYARKCHVIWYVVPILLTFSSFVFSYCLGILESLAADHYMVVYLHGGTADRNVPKFRWMRRCYPMLDRRYLHSFLHFI